MRTLSRLLAALLMSGCMNTESNPVAPATRNPKIQNLTILVAVSGDPSTGPEQYQVMLDGATFAKVWPNHETPFTVAAGGHQISLMSSVPGLFPSWCTPLGPSWLIGELKADVMTTLTFSIDCPSVDGVGGLQLSVSPLRNGLATQDTVRLSRLNGSPLTKLVPVPAGNAIKMELPAGFYGFRAGRCTTLLSAMTYRGSTAAIRAGEHISVTVSPCP
jgi:hypothetical protein